MISLILAVDKNYLLGNSNNEMGMPWDIPEDMKHFARVTRGKTVLGGRVTFSAIGKALPGRTNLMLTNKDATKIKNVKSINDARSLIEQFKSGNDELVIIGGKSIYEQFFADCDKVYVTRINEKFVGDIYFEKLDDYLKDFELIKKVVGQNSNLTFEEYKKR